MTAPGNELLALARSDPIRAIALVDELLPQAVDQPRRLSALHRARGQAAMVLANYPLAASSFEAAVAAARTGNDAATAHRISVSLAGAYFDLGDPTRAFATLDGVDREARGELLGISLGQRAGLLVDQGHLEEALHYFEQSMPHLEGGEDRFHVANSHQNMGNLRLESGDPDAASDSYRAALALFIELDMPIKSAAVSHNLARIAGQRGDLIGAIESFEETEQLYREGAGGRSLHGADKCDVLIQAGLLEEAVAESRELKQHAARTGDPRQLGYAHYLTSLAYSIAGRRTEAIEEANAAVRVFADNTSMILAGRAQLVELECLDPDEAHAGAALELARVFSKHGHRSSEIAAISVACRHSPRLSNADQDRLTEGLSDARSQVRRASRLGLVRICLDDEPEEAIGLLHEALDDLSRFVGLQASAAVRRSMAAHLSEIQALGLSLLVGRGDGEGLARWIDDTRLVSSTLPTLRPVADRKLAEMVAKLQAIEADPTEKESVEAARLEAQILKRSRISSSQTGTVPSPSSAPTIPGEVLVLRYYREGGKLSRIESGPLGHSLVDLGPEPEIRSSMAFLGADLRRLARSPNDHGLVAEIDSSVGALRARLLPDADQGLAICPAPVSVFSLVGAGPPRPGHHGRPVYALLEPRTRARPNSFGSDDPDCDRRPRARTRRSRDRFRRGRTGLRCLPRRLRRLGPGHNRRPKPAWYCPPGLPRKPPPFKPSFLVDPAGRRKPVCPRH